MKNKSEVIHNPKPDDLDSGCFYWIKKENNSSVYKYYKRRRYNKQDEHLFYPAGSEIPYYFMHDDDALNLFEKRLERLSYFSEGQNLCKGEDNGG